MVNVSFVFVLNEREGWSVLLSWLKIRFIRIKIHVNILPLHLLPLGAEISDNSDGLNQWEKFTLTIIVLTRNLPVLRVAICGEYFYFSFKLFLWGMSKALSSIWPQVDYPTAGSS